jgi:predicted TIM-barrel fold metal-dependent hydrolase
MVPALTPITFCFSAAILFSASARAGGADTPALDATAPDQLLLKNYKPRSIFKIPEHHVEKAKYPVIDMHTHDYAEVDKWVQTMDEVGLEKSIILSGAAGSKFDQALAKYRKYPNRFEVWCGIDYTGFDQPGFGPGAIAELERCRKAGATGIGELSDKGRGLGATTNTLGLHIDDARMDPILDRCAELHLPINIHVGEDKWMYEPMDQNNDGLMNAWTWRVRIDPGVFSHDEVVDTLEHALKKHPQTVFIACHLANCCSDLNHLGSMLDQYPNLYADIGARYAEIAPIPRFMLQFFKKYKDRLVYGTDLSPEAEMYRVTFRILETADEHFYAAHLRNYHWPLYGFELPDEVLKKLYRENALGILAWGSH